MPGLRIDAPVRPVGPVADLGPRVALCLLVGVVASCAGGADAPTAGSSVDTVERAYALAQRSLSEAGIYHGTLETTGDLGPTAARLTMELHVDARHDLVRQTVSRPRMGDVPAQQSTTIVADGVRWIEGRPLSSWKCPGGGSAAVGAVLGCPDPSESSTSRVEQGTRDGRPAIVLVTTGMRSGSDSSTQFTTRTYLDPSSGLPLAREEEGVTDSGKIERFSMLTRFRHEFLPAGTLPANFFDAASLGWRDDPEGELPVGVPVYWLGPRFDPGAGLPPIVMAGAAPGGGPGYAAILEYADETDRHGPPLVTLQLWSRAAWDAARADEVFGVCPGREPITLPQGEGRFVCPAAPPGTTPAGPNGPLGALVRFPDAVVVVSAPETFSPATGGSTSPYRTDEAMGRVLAGLRVRP